MEKTSIQQLDDLLAQYQTKVDFFHKAAGDYRAYPRGSKQIILEMIVKQAKKGARPRPEGNGLRLENPLHAFGKIKRKTANLRIIYRPREGDDGYLHMEIIAIGPRDKKEVYKAAEERLVEFFKKLGK